MSDIKVQKCIVDFFTCLSNSYSNCKTILEKSRHITSKIHNLIRRQNSLNKVNVTDASLETCDEMINKVIFLLQIDIDNGIRELQDNCEALLNDYEMIYKKMIHFENTSNEIDFNEDSELVNGSAFQPCLSDLLEYSRDGAHFLHGIWTQVKFVLFHITSYKTSCNFEAILNEYFKIDETSEEKIKYILSITQFCNKTEL